MGKYVKKGRVYVETATNIDRIEFNGTLYRRYPDSPRKHLQRYYSRSGGRGFLHRDIWQQANGAIPDGYIVHHIDGDTLNNALCNLACITVKQHCDEHAEANRAYGRSEKQKGHLASIRGKAAAWHKSPEGVAWHAQHGKASWKNRVEVHLVCQHCGEGFESFVSTALYCSKPCQNKAWYAAHPDYGAQKRARADARRLQLNGG